MPPIEFHSLARTLNEILILESVRDGPKHGYQIAIGIEERSGGYFSFNHGTLYPILHHLEKQGYIDGDWDDGRGTRRRKEYRLTAAGDGYLRERIAGWRELGERVSDFLGEVPPVRLRAAENER